MKRVCALAVLGVGFAIAGVVFASVGSGRGLKPQALAFMRSVAIPANGAPPAIRNAFAEHRFAGSPRKVLEIGKGRGRMILWVSPLRGRGWCSALQQRATRVFVQCTWWKPIFGPFSGGYVGPQLFVGRAAVTPGRELRLAFADGTVARVPARDGFYLYRTPGKLLLRSFPRALVLRNGQRRLAHLNLLPGHDLEMPFGGIRRPPGGADKARARLVVAGRTKAGPAAIFAAPSRLRPATCWWLQIRRAVYGGSCARTDRDTSKLWSIAPVRLHVRGRELWVLWGRVGSRYGSLEVRGQNGVTSKLRLRHGYFLYLVPRELRRAGRRPAVVAGRRRDGHVLRTQPLFTFAWAPYGP